MGRPRRKQTPFASVLSALLKERGIGVREAARIAGCAPSTITGWTGGTIPDDFIAVKRLAKALGCSFSFLLTGEEDQRDKTAPTSIAEVFDDGGLIFDGYAKIQIQRLVPRTQKRKVE